MLFGEFGDQHATWQGLLDRGVLVRDVGLPGWLRVTAGTEAETSAFLDALREGMAEAEPVAVAAGGAAADDGEVDQ